MSLTPVTLTDTFDVWRTRTNQIIAVTEETTSNVSNTRNIAVSAFGQANLAFTQANNVGGAVTTANNTAIAAFGQANLAFTQANNVGGAVTTANSNIVASFNQANTATTIGSSAFGQANTATTIGSSAFGQANTATTIGSSAFGQANTATTIGSSAFGQANTATTIGSSAFGQANLAFTQANNVGGAVTTANNIAIAAFGQANAASVVIQNSQTSGYTLILADNGKHISTTANVTVPASVFSVGDTVTIYNNSSSSITIIQDASVTLRQVGTATTGNRTLAQRGLATILSVASDEFVITGGGLT
jgi:hypothetical protein